jgi:hypothetical protein
MSVVAVLGVLGVERGCRCRAVAVLRVLRASVVKTALPLPAARCPREAYGERMSSGCPRKLPEAP